MTSSALQRQTGYARPACVKASHSSTRHSSVAPQFAGAPTWMRRWGRSAGKETLSGGWPQASSKRWLTGLLGAFWRSGGGWSSWRRW